MQKNTLHNNVQKLRAEKKVTQEELAQNVGVSRQTIIAIEKQHYLPSILLALRIAAFFHKPVEEVFRLDG